MGDFSYGRIRKRRRQAWLLFPEVFPLLESTTLLLQEHAWVGQRKGVSLRDRSSKEPRSYTQRERQATHTHCLPTLAPHFNWEMTAYSLTCLKHTFGQTFLATNYDCLLTFTNQNKNGVKMGEA